MGEECTRIQLVLLIGLVIVAVLYCMANTNNPEINYVKSL